MHVAAREAFLQAPRWPQSPEEPVTEPEPEPKRPEVQALGMVGGGGIPRAGGGGPCAVAGAKTVGGRRRTGAVSANIGNS
jgi:hypothetical protein